MRLAHALAALALLAAPAAAQDRIPSHCIALAEATPGMEYLHKAAWGDPLPADWVRINYVGHATFAIETPGGLVAATDFTGDLGTTEVVPDVVTMNHAHTTHWTPSPDPRIPHVLRGWGAGYGDAAEHHLDLGHGQHQHDDEHGHQRAA